MQRLARRPQKEITRKARGPLEDGEGLLSGW
jgi:hypothetical protein